MPVKGQIFKHPGTGDVYEFLETAKDTNGARVTMKLTIRTKRKLVPDHFHVVQDEHFEVLAGKLTIWLDGKLYILEAGDKMALPKNVPHNHYNNEDEPMTIIQTVSPALDFEYLIENLVGLSIDGNRPNGKSGFFQNFVMLKYLDSKNYLTGIPVGVQKMLINLFGPIGRLLGYRAVYKKYSGFEK